MYCICFFVYYYRKRTCAVYGVYVSFVDLNSIEQGSRGTATVWANAQFNRVMYPPRRLSASSAFKAIKPRTVVYKIKYKKFTEM